MKFVIPIVIILFLGYVEFNLKTKEQLENSNKIIEQLQNSLSQSNQTIGMIENYYNKTSLYQLPIHEDDFIKYSSPFGFRKLIDPSTGGSRRSNHQGLDITGTYHARVLSIADGKVIDRWYVPGGRKEGHPLFGGYVRILHDDGVISGYGHLSKIYVYEGLIVQQGQLIGRTGNTGLSYGEHLHFSLEKDDIFLNPLKYIGKNNGQI